MGYPCSECGQYSECQCGEIEETLIDAVQNKMNEQRLITLGMLYELDREFKNFDFPPDFEMFLEDWLRKAFRAEERDPKWKSRNDYIEKYNANEMRNYGRIITPIQFDDRDGGLQ